MPGEADLVEHLERDRAPVAVGDADRDVVPDALPREQPVLLKHDRPLARDGDRAAVGQVQARSSRSSVLLPQPDWPSRITNSRGAIRRSSWSSTVRSPKRRTTPLAVTLSRSLTDWRGGRGGGGDGAHARPPVADGPPTEQVALQHPDDLIAGQAEDRVDHQTEEHLVDPVEGLRLVDHEADPGVGVDLLGDDEAEDAVRDRQPQADQRAWERSGEHDPGQQTQRLTPAARAISTRRWSTFRIAPNRLM